jgi:hypothetical protein
MRLEALTAIKANNPLSKTAVIPIHIRAINMFGSSRMVND